VPRLLDLFCGAGGASVGYAMAGFEVVGVDVKPQPRYPFRFILADALEIDLGGFDAYHASPPCQAHTRMRSRHPGREYPDLIADVRERLAATGKPYVIENVPGAPLVDPVMLCGTHFGLGTARQELRRHRLFECSFPVEPPPRCDHRKPALGVYGHTGGIENRRPGQPPRATVAEWRQGMGIDWMTRDELAQAIPPLYTLWIAQEMLKCDAMRRIHAAGN
jgi:DNA (cytosine-5)-methyltransferase 1